MEIRDDIGRELIEIRKVRAAAFEIIAGLSAAEGDDSEGYTIVLSVRDEADDNVITVIDYAFRTQLSIKRWGNAPKPNPCATD